MFHVSVCVRERACTHTHTHRQEHCLHRKSGLNKIEGSKSTGLGILAMHVHCVVVQEEKYRSRIPQTSLPHPPASSGSTARGRSLSSVRALPIHTAYHSPGSASFIISVDPRITTAIAHESAGSMSEGWRAPSEAALLCVAEPIPWVSGLDPFSPTRALPSPEETNSLSELFCPAMGSTGHCPRRWCLPSTASFFGFRRNP